MRESSIQRKGVAPVLREVTEVRLGAAQSLWGEGQTHPAEQRFANEFVTALKLKRGIDIAIFGSGLCGGARTLADQLQTRVSCFEWDPVMAAAAAGLNLKSSAGFLVKNQLIEVADGFPVGRQYDSIIMALRLYERPDQAKLIKQIASALKPGGSLCMVNYLSCNETIPAEQRSVLFPNAAPGPLWRASDLHFALVGAQLDVVFETNVSQKFREAIVSGFGAMKDIVLAIMRQQANAGEALTQEVKVWAARHDAMKAGILDMRCTIAAKR